MTDPHPCPDALLTEAIEALKQSREGGLDRIEALLDAYRSDPRLHFIRGMALASLERYSEARGALRSAIQIAPDYGIARFKLGFLEFTAGEAAAAAATWSRLQNLRPDDALRLFAEGLLFLVRNEFDKAVVALEAGIARNVENPPINADIQVIIDRIRSQSRPPPAPTDEPTSLVQQLLQQSAAKRTLH